jgi:hypothetical protein
MAFYFGKSFVFPTNILSKKHLLKFLILHEKQ